MKWLARTIDKERENFEAARCRFVADPNPECLHDVRTTGRRLRSLLEDCADLAGKRKLLRKVKRAAEITDPARDAAVLRELLEDNVDDGERANARALIAHLRELESSATVKARRWFRRLALQ